MTGLISMGRKAWIIFGFVQLCGELGPWAGLRLKSAVGPALWVAGMVAMIPGRLLGLFITEKLLWNVGHNPHVMTLLLVLVEVSTNLVVWLLCARLFWLLRKRHAGRAISSTTSP